MTFNRASVSIYLIMSYLWMGVGWYFSSQIPEGLLWKALIGSILIAAPIFAFGLYRTTTRNIHRSVALKSESWIRGLYSRRFFSTIFWASWSVIASFCLLFWFWLLDRDEWFLLLSSVPVFLTLKYLVHRSIGEQFRPYYATGKVLGITQVLYAAVMSAGFVWLAFSTLNSDQEFYLSEVIRAEQSKPISFNKSLLLQYSQRIAAYYSGANEFALSNLLRYGSALPLLIAFIGSFAVFLHLSLGFSGFLVPRSEYRRLVAPTDEVDIPPDSDLSQTILVSALVVVVVGFIYVPGFAQLDYQLKQRPGIAEAITGVEDAALPHFEMIEDRFFRPGTIAAGGSLARDLLKKHRANTGLLRQAAEEGYLKMVHNIDDYLDWYYSLPAEYLRVGAMLTGSLEGRLEKDLKTFLGAGDPFSILGDTMNATFEDNQQLREEYLASINTLLTENEVFPGAPKVQITRYVPMEAFMQPANDIVGIDLKARLGASGVGAITGLVAAKVVAKAVSKGTMKLAAKAMTKAATTRATAGTAGAAIGGLIGSVIPGAGTLVGSAIGASLGLMFGISVDALLLTIDEYLTRDEFRTQIIEAIIESKTLFLDELTV